MDQSLQATCTPDVHRPPRTFETTSAQSLRCSNVSNCLFSNHEFRIMVCSRLYESRWRLGLCEESPDTEDGDTIVALPACAAMAADNDPRATSSAVCMYVCAYMYVCL